MSVHPISMRGSPLLQSILALLVLLGLGWPLQQLLSREKAEVVVASPTLPAFAPEGEKTEAVLLQIDFTTPPERLVVKSLGQTVWEELAPGASVQRKLSMQYPAEGVDLDFDFGFAPDARAAARVQLTPPNGEVQTQTVWAEGATSTVLTFH